jgi:hypothetical protein
MASEAATEDLIYVSNLKNVKVYSYRAGKHVGTLRGFYEASGECVDSAGDVFVADGDFVAEYKHGGKQRIQTLTFSGYAAVDCASDPATGNLAVTWAGSNGYVAIYRHASGNPTLYSYSTDFPRGCGYDDKSDLFVGGMTNHGAQFTFEELPEGGSALESISLNQSVGAGGSVQWDGKYVTVEDLQANEIYRFAISGSSGTLEGKVDLVEAPSQYHPGPTWIVGTRVLEPNIAFVHYQPIGEVDYFRYPQGGSATKIIVDGDDTAPDDVAVSVAPH